MKYGTWIDRSALVMVVLLVGGCAISKETYLPDGRVGYSISCDGAAVGMNVCFEKAGEICGARGYDLLNREGQVIPMGMGNASLSGNAYGYQGQAFAYSGAFNSKSIMVRCRD
ncbi:MAG: hypothetical protein IV085_14100 [Thiobacillus sp.]|nr:hypothetical protein [Thiobacillus sp.]